MLREQHGYAAEIYDSQTQSFDYDEEDQIVEDLPRRRNNWTPEEYDEQEPQTRHTTSTRRYVQRQPAPTSRAIMRYEQSPVPARRSRTQQQRASMRARNTDDIPAQKKATPHKMRHNAGWYMVRGGMVVCIMVVGHVFFTMFGAWCDTIYNNIVYGNPRTATYNQTLANDATASHFIAQNNNCHISVIVQEDNDLSKSSVVDAGTLIGSGCSSMPVTLTFKDINGDGKLDMVVQAGGVQTPYIYDKKDDKNVFRPVNSSDKISN